MPDTDLQKLSSGHSDNELLFALEPDQLVAEAARPLPRHVLGRAANLALWALRIFVLIISALVIYTFVRSLY